MDAKTSLLVVALQVAALAVLYQRFGGAWFGWKCGMEESAELLVFGSKVATPESIQPATLHVKDGKIQQVFLRKAPADLPTLGELRAIDYGDLVIFPGLLDTHVHFNEPGLDQREGIRSGTRSAAAGGVTTVVDMPQYSSPPTDSCRRLKSKIFRYRQESFVNIGSWGGLTPINAADAEELRCMVEETGAFGFYSILAGDGSKLLPVNATHLTRAIPLLKELGVPLSLRTQTPPEEGGDWTGEQEKAAVEMILAVLKQDAQNLGKPGFAVHFTGVSNAATLQSIADAKADGLPVSVELAVHFLRFSEKTANNSALLRTIPPLSTEQNRKALLKAVREGKVDLIVSEHTPATPQEKQTSLHEALPGVTGNQYLLPVAHTALSSLATSDSDLLRLRDLLSTRPAQLLGLGSSKGKIAAGYDADLVVWNPEGQSDTTKKGCYMAHPALCPYLETYLRGGIRATWLKGNLVFDDRRGLAWGSCRKVYGLGDWAKTVVLWFYEISFVE